MYGTYDTEFIYFTEGEAHSGTIHDLADALRISYYQGFDVANFVYIFENTEPIKLPVYVSHGKYDDNDYARNKVSIIFPSQDYLGVTEDFELEAFYTIDGRA